MTSLYIRNQKLIELLPWINCIAKDPMELWNLPVEKKDKYQIISQGLEMFRHYQLLDKEKNILA